MSNIKTFKKGLAGKQFAGDADLKQAVTWVDP
jgi:hypothetical protein